jgi:hypothetical protein
LFLSLKAILSMTEHQKCPFWKDVFYFFITNHKNFSFQKLYLLRNFILTKSNFWETFSFERNHLWQWENKVCLFNDWKRRNTNFFAFCYCASFCFVTLDILFN